MIYQLDELQRIGNGRSKIVYQHPTDVDKVIKVMNPERVDSDGGWKGHGSLKRRMNQGVYKQFRREILQYFQLCKNHYSLNQFTFPVETVYGLVQTNYGLALVTEKIISPDGMGMTLDELCYKNLFEAKHAKALDQFFNNCCDLHIIFGEVNRGGLMYTENRHGQPEFVLVDGMGEKLLIPFRAMSKTINTMNVRRVEKKIKRQISEILAKYDNQLMSIN